jgi:intein/homing endonuclease
MKRLIKYQSIEQFRGAVKQIQERACFIGLDEDGKAQFDYLKPKPVIRFDATEKIHGCLKFDTLITTQEYGDIPIKEIVDNKLKCNVLTKNLKTDELQWNLVLNFWNTSDDTKDWYKVTLEDGSEIIMTGNHKVYTPLNKDYTSCEDLRIGDVLLKR